jgi:hypothetical protein
MKIREIKLNQFKRFTDTTITDVPSEARLVVLAGPNGSGKSSLIDAVHMWHRTRWVQLGNWDETYHRKQIGGAAVEWHNAVDMQFYDPQPEGDEEKRKAVYTRSAYRNEAEFNMGSLSRVGPATRETRMARLIDNDALVSSNYQRLVSNGFEDVFEKAPPGQTMQDFREQTIGDIRDTVERLFPDLVLNGLGNPLSVGTFRFNKADSNAFLYKNLSGGEKAAFDLILDLVIKVREFDNTAFFIDEPESHIAPGLQGRLLEELLNHIPENSQLWIATHSIGMMRKARDIAREHPNSVAFIDFEGVNFDLPTVLRPVQPDRPFWKRAMQIALDDLAGYVAPERVVLCEGGYLLGQGNFDAECYNEIFKSEFPEAVFLSAGNANEIQNDPRGVGRLLAALAPQVVLTRLIDRDDRTDAEIANLRAQGVRVLSLRTIESYLLDNEILHALCEFFGEADVAPAMIQAKDAALAAGVGRGAPNDDFRRCSGEFYVAAKRLLPNQKLGSDARSFLKGLCAPLMTTQTQIYQRLRRDIFE